MCGVRSGPVVLAKALATPLVLGLGSAVCSVVLSFHCLFLSRDVCCVATSLVFSRPSAFPFALGFLVCSAQWGGRGIFEGADVLTYHHHHNHIKISCLSYSYSYRLHKGQAECEAPIVI